jgi:ABC-type amino acid transport substrate-binding protein
MKNLFMAIGILCILLVAGCTQVTDNRVDVNSMKLVSPGKLTVGTNIPYEPMEYYDESGKAVGVDIDIINEIANRLNVPVEVVNYGWDELFIAVNESKVDLAISSITITPERSVNFLFSVPYFNAGQIVITTNDNDKIKTPEDMSGMKIGAQKDTTSIDEANKYGTIAVPYDNMDEQIINDLKSGKIDAIVVDYIAALNIVQKDSSLKLVGDPFTQEFYGMVTKIGNDALIQDVNGAIRDMKRDGTLDDILSKWLKK